jgi:tetratricopeptide (TPR) repeat protein
MWHAVVALLVTDGGCQRLLAEGRAAYERGSYQEAVPLFERALAPCGAGAPLLLALGQAQLLSGQVAGAVYTLDRLLAEAPKHVEALKVKAKALYLAGRDAEAEAALHQAGALAPTDDEIPYSLGRMYYQRQRHARAAEEFRRAIELNPRSHKAYDNLGLATEALGDVAEALRHYLKAIELARASDPRYDVVYANLADLMLKLGEHRRAFDLAVEAAERNPRDARNFFLAGKALVRLERYDVSLRWFDQAIALDPADPQPRYLLAQAYRRLGRTAEAERMLKAFQEVQARAPAVRR